MYKCMYIHVTTYTYIHLYIYLYNCIYTYTSSYIYYIYTYIIYIWNRREYKQCSKCLNVKRWHKSIIWKRLERHQFCDACCSWTSSCYCSRPVVAATVAKRICYCKFMNSSPSCHCTIYIHIYIYIYIYINIYFFIHFYVK